MTTDVSSTTDILSLAASLKERLGEALGEVRLDGTVADESVADASSTPPQLRDEILEALDLLVLQSETVQELESALSSQPSPNPANPDSRSADALREDLTSRLTDALDDSLSQWQVQISASFTQAVARDLKEQFNTLGRLNTEAREYQQRLNEQRQALDAEMAEALRLKARLSRQRKVLAKEIRAQRAEMLCEVERERNSSRAGLENTLRLEVEQSLRSEYEQKWADIERRSDEQQTLAEELQRKLATEESGVERLQTENTELISQLESRDDEACVAELERELGAARERLAALEVELALREGTAAEATHERTSELEAALAAARDELTEAHRQIEDLRNQPAPEHATAQNDQRLDQLEGELFKKHLEIEDLKSQNSDLAAQIAKRQVDDSGRTPHVSFNQESLTWEERKKIIMQQLECESSVPETCEVESRQLEIRDVISATQMEIERRDQEIEELKSIVEHQSNTHEGVAVGAAAIAQMIDSDELVNQERQRLKDIQQEWEAKLRKAEIDLSLERAKLARERLQLEEELAKAREATTLEFQAEDGESKAETRTRKWLSHLGLKESRTE